MTEAAHQKLWRRFTPAQRVARFGVYLVIVAAIVASVQTVEVIPEFLADAPEQVADLFARMWPVDLAYYPRGVHAALMETIHIASLGTLLALVLALPVGLLAAHNLCPFTPVNLLAKPGVLALGELPLLGATLRRDLRTGSTRRNARDRIPLDRLRRQTLRRGARGDQPWSDRGARRCGRARAVAIVLRLLAAGEARVLVHRSVSLGHQCPRVGGAGSR